MPKYLIAIEDKNCTQQIACWIEAEEKNAALEFYFSVKPDRVSATKKIIREGGRMIVKQCKERNVR